MNVNQKAFFDNLEELRKINFADMFSGVSKGDLCMMKLLRERTVNAEEIRVSEIVEAMKAPAPAVSRTLKVLEQKGFILRRVDETDRRNTFVELTDSGVEISSVIDQKMSSLADAVFREIGEDTFVQLNHHLTQLIQVTRKEMEKRLEK